MHIEVLGCRVHVVDTGPVAAQGGGVPTLFLHGNPDSSEVWAGVLPAVAAHGRCLAPDLPGFGHSSAPPDFDCSLDGMARFVEALLQALGATGPVNLAVHDIGGPYGLAWAVRHPQRVQRLVIMNTVFHADYRWHRLGRLWRTPLVGELVQALTTRAAFVQEMRRGSRRLSAAHMHRTYDLVTPATRRMVLRWYRAMDPQHFTGWQQALEALTARVPTQVLWGEHDPYIPLRYAGRFGQAEVRRFAGVGHWLPAEAPAEVAEHLVSFLYPQPLMPG